MSTCAGLNVLAGVVTAAVAGKVWFTAGTVIVTVLLNAPEVTVIVELPTATPVAVTLEPVVAESETFEPSEVVQEKVCPLRIVLLEFRAVATSVSVAA